MSKALFAPSGVFLLPPGGITEVGIGTGIGMLVVKRRHAQVCLGNDMPEGRPDFRDGRRTFLSLFYSRFSSLYSHTHIYKYAFIALKIFFNFFISLELLHGQLWFAWPGYWTGTTEMMEVEWLEDIFRYGGYNKQEFCCTCNRDEIKWTKSL